MFVHFVIHLSLPAIESAAPRMTQTPVFGVGYSVCLDDRKCFIAGILHDMEHRPVIPGYQYAGTVEQVGTAVADESFK
jgi:hypothetical protein